MKTLNHSNKSTISFPDPDNIEITPATFLFIRKYILVSMNKRDNPL